MDDVTRLSRCARCGAGLPIDAAGDLCASCDRALASELTVLGRPSDDGDVTRIVVPLITGGNDQTMLSARSRGPVAPKLEPGQTFGSYRVERLLGRGGMGDVYEAEHLDHGRRVAIKVLNSALAGEEDRARFLSEGRLAASITDPNTVYIFGSEEIDGAPVIAMELLSGGTLRDLVQAKGPLPPAEAVDVILQVIAGLDAAARTGILHRDVKPANCFVDLQGRVKVGDFGLSITTFGHQQTTGMFLGTPQYAPPEQIRGEALDLRADIYAVGGTLFYLLTGQPPFDDQDLTTLITRVTTEAPKSPREMSAKVPPGLADIVTRCLAKDRAGRPATYTALEDMLRPFCSTAPVPASLGRRVLAGVIDQSLFGVFVMPLMVSLVFSGSGLGFRWTLGLIQIPMWILYFGTLEGRWGASLGKRLMGLRVTRDDGQPAGGGPAAIRALVYQSPSIISLIPVLIIGPSRLDQFTIAHPFAGMALAVPFYLALAVLFSTARRRNGYAALQDLASRTRVVRALVRADRAATALAPDAASPSGSSATRIGPFDVIANLGSTGVGDVRLGFDSQLRRRVWIHVAPLGTSSIAPLLRDLARPARLRWLTGRRTSTEAWDAYEAFDGLALAALPSAQPWRVVRGWLLDLAQEADAARGDGTLGTLTIERVWVTRDGRAKLLDFRAPGLPARAIGGASATFDSVQTWLSAVAARGFGSLTAPLPLSARAFLDRLDAGSLTTTAAVVTEIAAIQARPDHVQPWRRAAAALLPGLTPVLFSALGFMAAIGMQRVAATTPDTDAAILALARLNALSTASDPASIDERRNLATFVAGTYRATLSNEQLWVNPIVGQRLAPYRQLAEQTLASHPTVTLEELESATAALGPFAANQRKAIENQRVKAMLAPRAGSIALFGIGLCISGIFGVVFAFALRGGLVMRILGLAVVDARGRPASRFRALLRAIVAWAPAFALAMLALNTRVLFADITYARAHPIATISTIVVGAVLLGGALVAAFGQRRAVQDVIARTNVVPR